MYQHVPSQTWDFKLYPLVICYIAIENCPVEIVDFPFKNGGSFHPFCKRVPGRVVHQTWRTKWRVTAGKILYGNRFGH